MNMRQGTELRVRWVRRTLTAIMLVGILIAAGHGVCFARSLTLAWEASPGADGYRVYYQADSSVPPFTGTGASQGASPIDVGNRTTATIDGLDPGRDYYFAVTSYSATTESVYSNVVHVPPLNAGLTVSVTVNGEGSVNSSPAGIACSTGTCSAQFASGSTVTLLATPANGANSLSFFSSWTGCSGTQGESCTVEVGAATSVTATFAALQPVRVWGGSFYSLLQSAYGGAGDGGVIQAQAVALSGDLTTNANRSVTLAGGFNADYSGTDGVTALEGTLTVAAGALTVGNLVIR